MCEPKKTKQTPYKTVDGFRLSPHDFNRLPTFPRITMTERELTVDCFVISREAFLSLAAKWNEYLNKSGVIQDGPAVLA